MSTIVIRGNPRTRTRARRRNPREGVVPKRGRGAMVLTVLFGILAVVVAGLANLMEPIGGRDPSMPATPDAAPSAGMVFRNDGAMLRTTARMVEACPALRPAARSMIVDRDLSNDEFRSLLAGSRRIGCPPSAR